MPRRADDDDYDDEDDRPRRRKAPPTNGVATAALVLGILGLCTGAVTGLPAVVCGFLGLSRAKATGTGKGMAIAGLLLGAFSTVAGVAAVAVGVYLAKKGGDAVADFRDRVQQDMANRDGQDRDRAAKLKQIGIAAANYDAVYSRYPNNTAADQLPGATPDARRWVPYGPPNQPFARLARSWRVDLLPYLEAEHVHREFKLNERWDSPANLPVADRNVPQYAASATTPSTRWRGFAGAGTVFEPYAATGPARIPDGSSNTIFCAEFEGLVKWTEPNDYIYGVPQALHMPNTAVTALPAFGRAGSDSGLVLMCDGSVRRMKKSIDPRVFAMLVGRADGTVIPEMPPLAD